MIDLDAMLVIAHNEYKQGQGRLPPKHRIESAADERPRTSVTSDILSP